MTIAEISTMGTRRPYKYSLQLMQIHEEWARKNGYRQATSYKRQATSDMLNAENSERFVKGAKRQAASDKRQASNGTSSNKR